MKKKSLFLLSLVMVGLSLSTSAQNNKKYYKKNHSKNVRYKNGKYRHAAVPAPRVVVLPPPPKPVIVLPPLPPRPPKHLRPRVRH